MSKVKEFCSIVAMIYVFICLFAGFFGFIERASDKRCKMPNVSKVFPTYQLGCWFGKRGR